MARCYESDKSQPGRPWYSRTLRFHDWLSSELQTHPSELGDRIDWLFRRALDDLRAAVRASGRGQAESAARQFSAYAERGFPEYGIDATLRRMIREPLAPYMANPDSAPWDEVALSVSEYMNRENRRKNLTGEGFEDLLAALLRRAGINPSELFVRRATSAIPGFANPQRAAGKPKEVDVAIVPRNGGLRSLISAKWSIRADREEQFRSDYEHYKAENARAEAFEYVLVTNEFDPARLVAACDSFVDNRQLFSQVIHIAPQAVLAAYGETGQSPTMRSVAKRIESGRLLSLGAWLTRFGA